MLQSGFFKTPGDHSPKMENPPLLNKVLSTAEKIDYIIHNEGSELGEAYEALKIYLDTCLPEEDQRRVLYFLDKHVNEDYEVVKEDIENEKALSDQSLRYFKDLPFTCTLVKVPMEHHEVLLIKIDQDLFDVYGRRMEISKYRVYSLRATFVE